MNQYLKRSTVFALLGWFAVTHWAAGQSAENTKTVMDKTEARKLYEQAKSQYETYEGAHGGWIQTKNVRMHYWQWHNPSGLPLVWVHGTYDAAYDIARIAEDLVKAGFRVIAIDYYGHGRTPIPPHEVSVYHVADDMAALMDTLGIAKAVIGGHSRGGTIAAAFYDSYPARTLGLILEDGGSFSWQKIFDTLTDEQLKKRFASIDSVSAILFRSYPTEFDLFYDVSKEGTLTYLTGLTDPVYILARTSQGTDGRWMFSRGLMQWLKEDSAVNVYNVVRRASTTTLFQWSNLAVMPKVIFRRLDVPMLIIDPVSDHDINDFPATDQNRELQQRYPELIVHRIYEDTGHNAHSERPAWFVRDVSSFLERVRQRWRR